MASQPNQGMEPVIVQPEGEREFHISQWLEVISRRRRMLVAVAATVIAGALLQYAITPRVFRATTALQIEVRSPNPAPIQERFDYNAYYTVMMFYPTQYRLLQSRGLAERVVKNLRLAEDPVFNPNRAGLGGSTSGATNAADDALALGNLARALLGGLEVTPVRNTMLVEVSYTSTSPDLAARIANGVADAFIDWGLETRYATAGRASSFLMSQIEKIKQEIQDKEAQLQAYSRRSDIVALDPASNVTLQRLEALNKEYIGAVSERINKEARYKELVSSPKESIAESVSGGLVTQLRGDVLKLEREYATKLNTYKPEWPAMQELKAQIEKSRQHFASVVQEMVGKAQDSARAEYQAAQRREESLNEELTRRKSEAMRFNSAAVEYNNLKVEVSTRRALLDELVRRQSETEVASRLQETRDSNVRIVDRALAPTAPYRPSLRLSTLLGLVLGCGFGLGAVFFMEYLDRTIKTADDVERVLGLPLLAVVPDVAQGRDRYGYGYGYGYYGRRKSKGKSPARRRARPKTADQGELQIEMLPHLMPRVSASEAYRGLRTSLLLSTAGELKQIVVTSAISGEGKTATATNLAVVLAQLEKQVLLVDADLRKPRIHEIFGLSNRLGLVNYLTGTADPATIFFRHALSGLYVTPAGPVPPNPAELLASDRMTEFIALVRQRFDYVVFDTPPTLLVTDSTVLGARSDGVVVTVGAGYVRRDDARACSDRLLLSEVKVLGVVLNRFQATRGHYGKRYRAYEAYEHEAAASTGRKAATQA